MCIYVVFTQHGKILTVTSLRTALTAVPRLRHISGPTTTAFSKQRFSRGTGSSVAGTARFCSLCSCLITKLLDRSFSGWKTLLTACWAKAEAWSAWTCQRCSLLCRPFSICSSSRTSLSISCLSSWHRSSTCNHQGSFTQHTNIRISVDSLVLFSFKNYDRY